MAENPRGLRVDWSNDRRDLAAVYRTFDALLGLVDARFTVSERVAVWPMPLAINAERLSASFGRVIGPLPTGLDQSRSPRAEGGSGSGAEARLDHPVFESLGFPDEDEVGRAAHEAAVEVLRSEPRVCDLLSPTSSAALEDRADGIDLLVSHALREAVARARESRLERMDRVLEPPELGRPVRLKDDLESEVYFLGALYGAIDGLASAATAHVAPEYMGDWEAALADDVQTVFQRPIPVSSFVDSEHDWMRDPFGGEFPIASNPPVPMPRVPASRPVSFDDDDEPTRGIYDDHAYAHLHSSAADVVEDEFELGWEAYEAAGGNDPETFPSDRVVRRAVRSVVGMMVAACRDVGALAEAADGTDPSRHRIVTL